MLFSLVNDLHIQDQSQIEILFKSIDIHRIYISSCKTLKSSFLSFKDKVSQKQFKKTSSIIKCITVQLK